MQRDLRLVSYDRRIDGVEIIGQPPLRAFVGLLDALPALLDLDPDRIPLDLHCPDLSSERRNLFDEVEHGIMGT